MEIGLSLGSNTGDRIAYLADARERIAHLKGVKLTNCSAVYETEPVDVPAACSEMPFLNAVVTIESERDAASLHSAFREIEKAMGRTADVPRNGPRPIDIDIVYAGELSMASDTLTVPHPRWPERRFVVEPLCSIRPNLTVVGQMSTVMDVLASLPDEPHVKLFCHQW